jgi:phosphoglycerate kinase
MANGREYGHPKKVRVHLPVDCTAVLDPRPRPRLLYQEVPDGWLIADISPAAITLFNEALQNAKTVVWTP